MFPISLDQSIRSIVESTTFTASSDGSTSVASESFDAHLSSSEQYAAPEQPPAASAATNPQEEKPEREEEPRSEATASPTPPLANSSPESKSETDDNYEAGERPADVPGAEDTAERPLETRTENQNTLLTETANISSVSEPQIESADVPTENLNPAATSAVPDVLVTTTDPVAVATVELDHNATESVTVVPEALEPLETTVESALASVTESLHEQTTEVATEIAAQLNGSAESAKPEARKSKGSHSEPSITAAKPMEVLATANTPVPVVSNALPDVASVAGSERDVKTEIAVGAPVERDAGQTPLSATNRLAQHLGVGSDERTAKANSLNGSDQNRFLDRVARAFKVAENRQGVVKLRLHPPELGALRIELRMQNGALNARLEAESAVTQSLLLEHAYALRDRLSEQGVRIARFDVELSDRRSMEHPNGFDERSHRDREPARNHRQEEPAAKSEATPLRPTTPAAPGNINVII